MALKRMLFAFGAPLFLVGWFIAFIGVALLQSRCADQLTENMLQGGAIGDFLPPIPGENCGRSFRFIWFILALCLVPTLLTFFVAAKPHASKASLTALWTIVAVFAILIANFVYNALDTISPSPAAVDLYRTRLRITMVGLCFMSAGALYNILTPMLMDDAHTEFSTDHHNKGGLHVDHVDKHVEHKVVGVSTTTVPMVVPVNQTGVNQRGSTAHTASHVV